MPKRVFHFYQRKRVVNINVNVFIAGLLSIAIAKYPIMLLSDIIGHEHKLKLSILAYVIDTVIDVLLYFGLHWIANHWRPIKQSGIVDTLTTPSESRTKNFLVDVGKVQAERFALVPIFALIAMGGMWALQHYSSLKPDWAFVVAFIIAMCVTRVIHTIWGYKSGTFRDHDHATDKPNGDTN
ncbi:hypothetical protein COB72_10655 [bacterium]|nr:MAG: hypothetical protein COB72_10655 [bacterium]